MDANFHLVKLEKNCDESDVSLWSGRGYYCDEKAFQRYLEKVGPVVHAEVSTACVNRVDLTICAFFL